MRILLASRAVASLTAVVIGVAVLWPHTSYAQSLEDRVQDLERRVQQLESKQTGRPAISAPAPGGGPDAWRGQTNWRTLKRGMSQDEVRRILGEPHKVDAFRSFMVWQYGVGVGATVNFDDRGGVTGWSEPPSR